MENNMNNLNNLQENLIFSEIDNLNFLSPNWPYINNEKEFGADLMENLDNLLDKSSHKNSAVKQIKFKIEKNKTFFFVSRKRKRKVDKKKEIFANGRWTKEERIKFAIGLWKFGTDWAKIKQYISTRSIIQIRSHAQKFLLKLISDEDLMKKGLQLKGLSWKDIIKLLKNSFNDIDFLNILISIESELGDNNRMTKNYIERKKNSKPKLYSLTEENNISLASSEDNSKNHIENGTSTSLLNEEEIKISLKGTILDESAPSQDLIYDNNFNYYHKSEENEKDNILLDKYINNNTNDYKSVSFDDSFYHNDSDKKNEEKENKYLYLLLP